MEPEAQERTEALTRSPAKLRSQELQLQQELNELAAVECAPA